MTRRRLLLVALLAALVLVGVAAWMVWPRSSAITQENAAKIQPSMTLAQVEAILGGPPRDESAGEPWSFEPDNFKLISDRVEVWIAPECTVWVGLKDGRVAISSVAWRIEEPILDRVRRRLGL